MDLTTTYMGFELANPFIAGASPLADDLGRVRQLEDAGIGAIILRSLFEEQLAAEGLATMRSVDGPANSYAEALTYLPSPDDFVLGPQEYLEHLARVKAAVSVPVIGSLNGVSLGGWLEYARQIEEAGADGLELHVYSVPVDPNESGAALEQRTIQMVETVKREVKIPVALKLSAFYTSFGNMAKRLDAVGADALVLFNRFYHPDIDIDNLEVVSKLKLTDSSDLPLRLRWLAIVSGRVRASLGVTGGVHTLSDVVKAIMCGAHGVQLVSSLLQRGPAYAGSLRDQLRAWLEENEYESLGQMRGNMSLLHCPDPKAFNRASYMQVLQTWEV